MLGFLEDIKVQLCGLIPLLLICFFTFIGSKKGVTLKGSFVYHQLLIVTTACVAMDIASVMSMNRAPHMFEVLLCRAYLWLTIMTGYVSVYYIWFNISTLRKYVKQRKTMSVIIIIIGTVVAFFLPIRFHKASGEFYRFGFLLIVIIAFCNDIAFRIISFYSVESLSLFAEF